MTRIMVDEVLRAKLGELTSQVELCGAHGETLGYFIPAAGRERPDKPPVEIPYTAEEIASSRAVRTGKPLEEILGRLGL